MRASSVGIASLCMLLSASFLVLVTPGAAHQKPVELTVAAAADLSSALKQIASSYEQKTGVRLKLSFGSSGMLTQELQNGAPFDVFLSADMDYPRQLVVAGLAEGDSVTQYARGKLVLWTPSDSRLDLEHQGMNVLLDPSVKKIAIANPDHAPYGRAAVAALQHEREVRELVLDIQNLLHVRQGGRVGAGPVRGAGPRDRVHDGHLRPVHLAEEHDPAHTQLVGQRLGDDGGVAEFPRFLRIDLGHRPRRQ